MKTFDGLFAELSAKAAAGDPASGTVALLSGGVHAVGKKVVEEAAEAALSLALTLRSIRRPGGGITTGF